MMEVWTEKYRPLDFGEIVGQYEVVKKMAAFVKQRSMPHCLFAGPAGTGKTTSALVMAKKLYGGRWKNNFMETNASDERGIDVVRSKIKEFARVRPLGADFKIIFLDECDALTPPAQQALRRTMERFTATTRFILSCNYSSKIIPPIQSRCAVFRFRPINKDELTKRLDFIASKEKLSIAEEGMDALLEAADGDIRRAVNLLQSVAVTSKKIGREEVYKAAASLSPKEAGEILRTALGHGFMAARKKLADLMLVRGLSGVDIVKAFHREVLALDVSEKDKAMLIDKLGEYEFRIVEGGADDLQLEAFLAQVVALKNS